MLRYKAIEIFTSEAARCHKKPLVDAVIQYIRELKIAARCIVSRGVAGCYESGEVATTRLEVLSFNQPVRIYIAVPAAEADRVLEGLSGMVGEGIIALSDLNVVSYRAPNTFFPRQLKVRDVMTPDPQRVAAGAAVNAVVRVLLSSVFTGLPVVDPQNRPIGVITQGDLITRGGLPLRLGLLAASDEKRRESILAPLASRQAAAVMTAPAITIADDRPLAEAVERMLEKGVKRLPVVNRGGRLTGMLSRIDIFRTVMREAPDWNAFNAQKIEVARMKRVGDILRRDAQTVFPDTPLEEVLQIIDRDDIQRVAVVDEGGKLLGLISDADLLRFFKPEHEGIWHLLARARHPFQQEACRGDLQRCLLETKAGAVMTTDLVTVGEDMLIEEAIGLMVDKALKRLPVVDGDGRFKGMVSRDSLLRSGYGEPVSNGNADAGV